MNNATSLIVHSVFFLESIQDIYKFKLFKPQKAKEKNLHRDLKELEISNYSKFKETTSYIPVQGTDLNENSQKLKTAINKRGEIRHREIDIFIRNLKPDIEEMAGLKRQEDELTGTITEIIQCIAELNKLLHYKNVCLVSATVSVI